MEKETQAPIAGDADTRNDAHLGANGTHVDDKPAMPSNTSSESVVDAEKIPVVDEVKSPRDIHGIRWALVIVAILSSTFLFALDNTIVADVQPAIIHTFGEIDKLSWLAVSFLLGAVSTNLVWGKIYGQFNAKWLYVGCVALFEAGSAICGAANNMNTLIVGRAICGVGGAGLYVGVMTLLSLTTTEHERPIYIGSTGLTWGLGTVLGPIVGGAFTDSSATWRWAFYINLCIGGLFAPVYVFLLPSIDPQSGVKLLKRFREIDFLGAILVIGAFAAGVMAINFGGQVYAWNSGRTIALFVVSGVLFIAFALQQHFLFLTTESRRIFPVHFVMSRTMLVLFAMTSSAGTALFVPIYFIPLFFQFTRGDTALEAGVRLMPFVVFLVVACFVNGALMSKYGYYMPWYLGSGILVVIGGALLFTVNDHTSVAKIYGYSIILGTGSGAYAQASFAIAQAVVEPQWIASAVGFITCAQITGVTIALSIADSIFLSHSQSNILKHYPSLPPSEVKTLVSGVSSSAINQISSAELAKIANLIASSMKVVYILPITAGCLTVVLSLIMKREKLFLAAGGAA